MSSIALVGAGGHGKVVAEIAELNGYNKIVFFDDKYPQLEKVGSWPIEGLIKNLKQRSKDFNEVIVTNFLTGFGRQRAVNENVIGSDSKCDLCPLNLGPSCENDIQTLSIFVSRDLKLHDLTLVRS